MSLTRGRPPKAGAVREVSLMKSTRLIWTILISLALSGALAVGIACGGETETVTKVETVVVESRSRRSKRWSRPS